MIIFAPGQFNNFYTIKQYDNNTFKLTYLKRSISIFNEREIKRDINEEKLLNNISRSRTMIFDYAMTNNFDYFITLTIAKDKQDRYDLKGYIKDLGQFIRDYRKKYKVDIQYLLVPEKHKDGAWHMHGLIKGIPEEHLEKNNNGYLEWKLYYERFGFVNLDKIKSKIKVSKYITKYISKTLNNNKGVVEKNKKLYYASRGLKVPRTIKKGCFPDNLHTEIKFDYENEYIKQTIIDKTTLQNYFNIDSDLIE